jgi:energy-coupling factor transport system ATP-binding protein
MKIRFDDVSFRYPSPVASEEPVLREISFELAEGEFVGIAGPSGAGKTTLMQLFSGLLQPTSGRVIIDGQELWTDRKFRQQVRRRIGLVFQFPEAQLFADTVFDDVAFGPRNLDCPEREVRTRVEEAMSRVGLPVEEYGSRSPFHLSEGEKRRVALAGVLAMQPEVLVLDEPTAALDPEGAALVKQILHRLHRSGVTVVWISHDLDLLFETVHRFLLLRSGSLFYDGPKSLLRANLEILEEAGLTIPRLFRLVDRLERLGWQVPSEVYSFPDLCSCVIDGVPADTT